MNQSLIQRPSKSDRSAAKQRPAFLLVEMLICFAFLAIAAGIAVNLHRSRIEYDQKAYRHLRTQLMLENVGEPLRVVPFDELGDAAADLQSEYPVRIELFDFQSGATRGVHAVLEPALETTTTLRHHVWRLESGQ